MNIITSLNSFLNRNRLNAKNILDDFQSRAKMHKRENYAVKFNLIICTHLVSSI